MNGSFGLPSYRTNYQIQCIKFSPSLSAPTTFRTPNGKPHVIKFSAFFSVFFFSSIYTTQLSSFSPKYFLYISLPPNNPTKVQPVKATQQWLYLRHLLDPVHIMCYFCFFSSLSNFLEPQLLNSFFILFADNVQELHVYEINERDRGSPAYLRLSEKSINSLGDLVPFSNKASSQFLKYFLLLFYFCSLFFMTIY